MLHLYRRHRVACPHKAMTYRRCQCPIYVKGTLAGDFVKKALDMSNWSAAQTLIGRWTQAGQIGPLVDAGSQTIETAVTAFLEDLRARNLTEATIGKYVVLLSKRLQPWAETDEGTPFLRGLDLQALTRFRSTWPDAPLAKQKNQERLRAFFRWCLARGWITSNPADSLSAVKVRHSPTLPFVDDEMSRIVEAVDRYPLAYQLDTRTRLRAFVQTLRWSGLRIRDAVTLRWEDVRDGKIRLYTHKTGQHVYIPLPAPCVAALEAWREKAGAVYPFWTGNGLAKSAVADWQRSLRSLFELANVEGGHAHRFRDTFAVGLLLAGVDMTDVSTLLGHASIRVTEKHYSAWVSARQRRIEQIVQQTWPTPSAPISPETPPAAAPAPQPTVESAAIDREEVHPARTGTDDAQSRPTPPNVRQFVLVKGAAL